MSPWRAWRRAARTWAARIHVSMRRQAFSSSRWPETERNSIPARRKTLPTSGTGHCPQ